MKTALKYTLSLACIIYVLWGIDFGLLWKSFQNLHLQWLLLGQATLLLGLLPAAARIRLLSNNAATFSISLRAVLVAFAWNTILPARLGELAKAYTLKREAELQFSRAMNIVFWERFSDLNCLLLIAIVGAAIFRQSLLLAPLASIVGAIWACLILAKTSPQWTQALTNAIPFENIKSFAVGITDALSETMAPGTLITLSVLTVFIWGTFVGAISLTLVMGAGLHLDFGEIIVIILAGALGIAVPSAPAAVGVYETFVVSAFMLMGVTKENALVLALILHLFQTLIPTLLGLVVTPNVLGREWKTQQPETT